MHACAPSKQRIGDHLYSVNHDTNPSVSPPLCKGCCSAGGDFSEFGILIAVLKLGQSHDHGSVIQLWETSLCMNLWLSIFYMLTTLLYFWNQNLNMEVFMQIARKN
jgi:hypothetical protein